MVAHASETVEGRQWDIVYEFLDYLIDPSTPRPRWNEASALERRAVQAKLEIVRALFDRALACSEMEPRQEGQHHRLLRPTQLTMFHELPVASRK